MTLICGVDEAGRGPIAGPVYAAAVILDPARRIASSEARRMLMRSISSTVAQATAQAIARSLMRPASTSRRSAVSTLESAKPLTRFAGSRITAAA